MNVGDASDEVINLYHQVEALSKLAQLNLRKYEPLHTAATKELWAAIQGFEDPHAMVLLVRKLTRLTPY